MKYITLSLLITLVFSSSDLQVYSSKDYISSENGSVMMNVNIMGHVSKPGSYLVFDGVDLLTALSSAGGFLDGANLKEIIIYKSNGVVEKINFHEYTRLNKTIDSIRLNPNDTIYVNQKIFSKIISSTNLPTILLSFLNLIITLNK